MLHVQNKISVQSEIEGLIVNSYPGVSSEAVSISLMNNCNGLNTAEIED